MLRVCFDNLALYMQLLNFMPYCPDNSDAMPYYTAINRFYAAAMC